MAKILIVDDDKFLRRLFGKTFLRTGHIVLNAGNGLEGLEIGEKERPDAIILDYQMPVMNGSEMLEKLRQTSWGRTVPVLLVTAISSVTYVPNIDMADIVLQKPVAINELTSFVLRLLPGPATQA